MEKMDLKTHVGDPEDGSVEEEAMMIKEHLERVRDSRKHGFDPEMVAQPICSQPFDQSKALVKPPGNLHQHWLTYTIRR